MENLCKYSWDFVKTYKQQQKKNEYKKYMLNINYQSIISEEYEL